MVEKQIIIGDFTGNQLYRDYLNYFPKVAELFKYNPWQKSSFDERAKEITVREREREQLRRDMVLSLYDYHLHLTDNPAVFNSIELMKNTDTKIVATGHQPGLLTGPLFAIYKAVTAVKMSEKLSQELNQSVLPVFWLASEDHDFEEINWIKTVNKKGEQICHQMEDNSESKSIKNRKLGEQAQEILHLLSANFHGTPYYEKWMNLFKKTEESSDNLADWTARILLELFGDRGLIVLDPMEPGIRKLSSPIFKAALSLGENYYETLNQSVSKLTDLGYFPQVDLKVNHTGLFYYYQGKRTPVTVQGNKYQLANLGIEFDYEQLFKELNSAPEKFSPNVTLRPVLQDYLLPTLAYVGGPGEVSYFSQLGDIYEKLGISMPIIYPRESFLLLETELIEIMDEYGIDLHNIFYNWPVTRKQIFRDIAPIDTAEIYRDSVSRFKREHQNLLEQLAQLDENIWKLEKKNFHLIMRQLHYLKEKSDQYHRKNQQYVRKELDYLKIKLYPENNLQEREYNIAEYLFRFDHDIIEELLDKPLNPRQITVIPTEKKS